MDNQIEDLGAQDPELKNSPLISEAEEDTETLRASIPGESGCLFNGRGYAHGTVIKSGTGLFQCDYGLWVPAGPADRENP